MNLKTELEIFYDDWYAHGYMDDWPVEKKVRVLNLLTELGLPATGKALDFGCGNGVFTDVLKKALPGWEVYGSDLSSLAVENASGRFPDCHFVDGASGVLRDVKFDLVFSHHVLEHVEDVEGTIDIVNSLCSNNAHMLHILPCGNKGSLEHRLCTYVRNGIQSDKGNTFFFEEEMHLQRFTSGQLVELFSRRGFFCKSAWYANQFWGALSWITGMDKSFIRKITVVRDASSGMNKLRIISWRFLLISLYHLFRPYYLFKDQDERGELRSFRKLRFNLSGYFRKNLEKMADREWSKSRTAENGSEMYLFFHKKTQGS